MIIDLSAVAEESNDAALEQEEDPDPVEGRRSLSAISGTTARTSHSAQELADLVADDMLDALPDLVDASDKVLKVVLLHQVAEVSDEQVETRIRTLQNPTSTASNKLSRQLPGYREQKAVYGNELYINQSIALRAMLGVRRPAEVGDGPWRPDDVFYKANLANLAFDVLALRGNVKQPFLEKMERDFPAPFLSQLSTMRHTSHTAGASSLVRETFETALCLRVQLFLSMMKHAPNFDAPNFDPDHVLHQLFLEDDKTMRGWDIDGLRTVDLSNQQIKEMVIRVDSIREHFSHEPRSQRFDKVVNIPALESQYPWSECVVKLLLWARQRANEIEAHLASLGGVDGLQEALGAELQNRKDVGSKLTDEDAGTVFLDYTPSELSHRPSEPSGTTKNATSIASKGARASLEYVPTILKVPSRQALANHGHRYSVPALVTRAKQKLAAVRLTQQREGVQQSPLIDNKASEMARSSANKRTQTTRSNDLQVPATLSVQVSEGVVDEDAIKEYDQPQVTDDDEPHGPSSPDVSPAERRRRILRVHRQSLAEQNKENLPQNELAFVSPQKKRSFIARQPNAQKVSFESQRSPQPGPSASRSKRARPDAEYEVEEDQESDVSQDDGFQTQVDLPRVSKPNQAAGIKRPSSAAASSRPPKRTRLTQGRERSVTLDPELQAAVNEANGQPPLSQIQIYNAARAQSKIATAHHVQKRVQRRTPWTDEETETLQDLIGTYGVSWSLLKSMDVGKVLTERDQVALKDKARNMYIDYLK